MPTVERVDDMGGGRRGRGPRRVLLLGDTHGSARWIGRAARVADAMALEGIVQVGDFGYCPGDEWHRQFLASVERVLASARMPLWFVRGNHDDVDALSRLARVGCRDEVGAVMVSPHVRYLPCGTRWTWGSTRMGALGGAFSVNGDELVEGESWWPGELIDEQALAALGTDPLDVLLTHEAPLASRTIRDRYAGDDGTVAQICTSQRRLVDEAVRATGAALVVHGHHHVRYDEHTGASRVIGLSCESWESMAVLDTESGDVSAVSSASIGVATAAADDAMLRQSQYAERNLESARAS